MANRGKRPTRKCTLSNQNTPNPSKAKITSTKAKLRSKSGVNRQNDETLGRNKRKRRESTDSNDSGDKVPHKPCQPKKGSNVEKEPIARKKKGQPKNQSTAASTSRNKNKAKAENIMKLPWEMTSKERYDELTRTDHVSTVPGFESYPSTRLFGVSWAGSLREILEDSDDESSVPFKKKKRAKKTSRKNVKAKKLTPVSRKSYVKQLLKDHPNVEETSFKRIQDVVFECLVDTMDENGTKNEFAQGFLESTVLTCSKAQRKQLLDNKVNGVHLFTKACELGNIDAVRFFIDCCDLDVNDVKGESGLMNAIMKKHYDIAKLIIQCGKKVNFTTDLAVTPLVVACGGYAVDFEGRGVNKKPIIPNQEPQAYDYEDYVEFKLRFPGQHGSFEVVEILIENGALKDIDADTLFNCFKCCIDNKHWDIMKLLIAEVDDINSVRNMFEVSVLGYAVEKLEEKAVKMLLKNGANINDTRMLLNHYMSKERENDDEDKSNDNSDGSSEDGSTKEDDGVKEAKKLNKTQESTSDLEHKSSDSKKDKLCSPRGSQSTDALTQNLNDSSCRRTRSLTIVKDKDDSQSRQTRSSTLVKNGDDTGFDVDSLSNEKSQHKQRSKLQKQTAICLEPLKIGKEGKKGKSTANTKKNMGSQEEVLDENHNKSTQLSKSKTSVKENSNSDIDQDLEQEIDDTFEEKVYVHPIVYVAAKDNKFLLYYFMNNEDIPFHEKMNALEIVGAKVVMSGNSNGAFGAWESTVLHRLHYPVKAGEIRHSRDDTDTKTPLFGISEPLTIEELDRHCPHNTLNALIISVLIYERTVGYHPSLFLEPVKKLGEYLFNNNMFTGYVDLLSRFLPKMLEVCDDNTPEQEECIRVLQHVTMLLKKKSKLCSIEPPFKETMALCESYFHAGCIAGTPEDPLTGYSEVTFKCYLIALDMLRGIEKNDDECSEFFSLMREVLQSNPKDNKMQTLLHHAVKPDPDLESSLRQIDISDINTDLDEVLYTDFGHTDMVLVLLYVGFDINAQDINGNTPFHRLFDNIYMWSSHASVLKPIYDLLDEFNAHPDIVNVYGATPMSRAKKCGINLTPASWLSLQCQAANVITKEKIPYNKHLPPALQKFVALHDYPEKKNGEDDFDDEDPIDYCSIM